MPYVPLSTSPSPAPAPVATGKGYVPLSSANPSPQAQTGYQPISQVGLLTPKAAPAPVSAASPASTTPYFQGEGYGPSTSLDPASGKPELYYKNDATKSTQLLSDRTDTTFDFTKPQKIDASILQNGRMDQRTSAAIKKQMIQELGPDGTTQLDHIMPLELGGSNEKSNLHLEPTLPGSKTNTATDPIENQLKTDAVSGKISVLDAWRQMAKAKGITLKEDQKPPQSTPAPVYSSIVPSQSLDGTTTEGSTASFGPKEADPVSAAIEHPVAALGGVVKGTADVFMNGLKGGANLVGAKGFADYVDQNQDAMNRIFQANMSSNDADTAGQVGQFVGQQIPYILGGEALGLAGQSASIAGLLKYGGELTPAQISTIGHIVKVSSNVLGFTGMNQLTFSPNQGSRLDQLRNDILTLGVLESLGFGSAAYSDAKSAGRVKDFLASLNSDNPPSLPDIATTVSSIKNGIQSDTGKSWLDLLKTALKGREGFVNFGASIGDEKETPSEPLTPENQSGNSKGGSNAEKTIRDLYSSDSRSESTKAATEEGINNATKTDSKVQAAIRDRNALEEKSATTPAPAQDGFIQKLKNIMTPLKQQDPETQKIFEDYSKKIANARPLANDEARTMANIRAEEGLDTMLRYERGQGTPYTEQIAKKFDTLLAEGRDRGLDTPERKNYIPHAYSENSQEMKQVMKGYLVKKGVPESQVEGFLNGTMELPQTEARRLGLNPFFTKTRTFPTYDEAIAAGLHPKFTHPAQLAGYYREQLERNVANRELTADLEKAGKLFPADLAPKGYKPVNLEFSPKGYYAQPRLAQMLNGLFNDSNSKTFFQHLTGISGKASRFVQKMELTTGIPKTSVNVHTIGQLIKDITAGDFKKIAPFLRANSDKASVRFFEANQDSIIRMANHGLDLGSTVADYPNMYDNFMRPDLRDAYERGGTKSAGAFIAKETGTAFENIFTKKNFSSFMPQLYVSTFKDASERFVSQGMSQAEADSLAVDTVKAFHGLMGNLGRSPGTEDGLSTAFFAPKFRESIINTLWNSLRSLGPEWNNPAFYKNRRLAGGMAISFGLYTAANKFLNGHYMWQNPSTHQFDLQIPTGNGNYAYVPFMPTFAAVPRNLLGGALSSVQGDIKGATQQFSTVFSAPLQLFGQLYANKDFFGRPIYKDTDPGTTKAGKIAQYLGLNTIPPFIKETVNYIEKKGQVPLYQALTTGAELPIKYGTDAKNNSSAFAQATQNYNALHAQAIDAFRPTFNSIQTLIQQGKNDDAQKLVNNLSDSDYALYKDLKAGATRLTTSKAEAQFLPTYQEIKALLTQGKTGEAQSRVNALSDSEYKLYQAIKKKGL